MEVKLLQIRRDGKEALKFWVLAVHLYAQDENERHAALGAGLRHAFGDVAIVSLAADAPVRTHSTEWRNGWMERVHCFLEAHWESYKSGDSVCLPQEPPLERGR